jgi:hypothetical protein
MNNQKTIGGRQYSFGMLPPTEAIEVEVAVARVVGEPLFKAFTEGGLNGKDEESLKATGMMAMGLMTSKMDAKEITATMKLCFKYVSCNGERIEFESHFMGRNREVWEVFFAALRHNFADFLPASLSGSLAKLVK